MQQQRSDFADQAAGLAEITNSILDQIRKLAELHKDGILTDEEFTAKKQELLARL